MIVVHTTVPDKDEADRLAELVVEQKLAACVQVLPGLTSFYFWKGKIQKDSECLILIKTLPEKYSALESFIKANHSYSVPEIVSIKAESVSEDYLKWMKEYLD